MMGISRRDFLKSAPAAVAVAALPAAAPHDPWAGRRVRVHHPEVHFRRDKQGAVGTVSKSRTYKYLCKESPQWRLAEVRFDDGDIREFNTYRLQFA